MGDNVLVESCTVHLKTFAWSSMFVHKIMHSSATDGNPTGVRSYSEISLEFTVRARFYSYTFFRQIYGLRAKIGGLSKWAFIKYLNPGTLR